MWSAQGRFRDGADLSLGASLDWRRGDIPLASPPAPLTADPALRARWDRALLDWLRQGDAAPALELRDLCLGLALGQPELAERAFWKIGAAFFEVQALAPSPRDAELKRLALHILLHCAARSRGDAEPAPEELARRLLAHCGTVAATAADAPLWRALRLAYAAGPVAAGEDRWLGPADEDSQRLEAALAAWAAALPSPLPGNAAPWAWSLAVRAGEAGLAVLAGFAAELAQALQAAMRGVTPEQAATLAAAAEHLRQLLHQHAAGFDKAPQPALLQGLRDLSRTSA